MSYRIAIASSNGESVNQHFGNAENFLIYEVSKEKVSFVEDRPMQSSSIGAGHSDEKVVYLADQLQDCSVVFVTKIGMKASRYLYQHKLKSFQVNFSLNYIFTTLLRNEQSSRIKII